MALHPPSVLVERQKDTTDVYLLHKPKNAESFVFETKHKYAGDVSEDTRAARRANYVERHFTVHDGR